MILSLDADFLGEGTEQIRLSREFAARREPSRQMNRLYVVEPALTITGGMADHRLRMKGGDVGVVPGGGGLGAGRAAASPRWRRWRR